MAGTSAPMIVLSIIGYLKKRVFEFHTSLNSELDEAKGRVIGKKPLLFLYEVFAYIRREESRRNVKMGRQEVIQLTNQ